MTSSSCVTSSRLHDVNEGLRGSRAEGRNGRGGGVGGGIRILERKKKMMKKGYKLMILYINVLVTIIEELPE